MDAEQAIITVNVALLKVGGKLVWGKPKSRAGERVVGLDATSVAIGRAHRLRRRRERLAAGEVLHHSGRIFTYEDGSPLYPEYVTKRFKALTQEAGLPVIKFHAARHTAASLALARGGDRHQGRVRPTRSLHDPDHAGPLPARASAGAPGRGRDGGRAPSRSQHAKDTGS
jgi:integrase